MSVRQGIALLEMRLHMLEVEGARQICGSTPQCSV